MVFNGCLSNESEQSNNGKDLQSSESSIKGILHLDLRLTVERYLFQLKTLMDFIHIFTCDLLMI